MKAPSLFEQIPLSTTLFLCIIKREPGITGYEIIKIIPQIIKSEVTIKSGTLYTQLRKLEANGLVTSIREQNGRQQRRYTITTRGEKELNNNKKKIQNRIDNILKPLLGYIEESISPENLPEK
ncbi:MAG: PadR family transcriptional regulator [Promethearchaeota archaeon]